MVVRFAVSGVQVNDARLAAFIIGHGLTHVLTLNVSDFSRYAPEGIVCVHPDSV